MQNNSPAPIQTISVPCNGCTLCCHRDAIRLLPDDDTSRYQTEPHFAIPDALMLAHKSNGDCIYLEANGCGIHDYKPQQCREMDCRIIAARVSFTKARKLHHRGLIKMPLWEKGRQLLRNHPEKEQLSRVTPIKNAFLKGLTK